MKPHGSRPITAHDVVALYEAEGWWPERTIGQLTAVLHRFPAVGAWHKDNLIGFARAVTDGVLRAYVEDVLVAPSFRNAGVGRALIANLLEQLRPIPVITLFCSPDHVSYYESVGFHATRQVVLHQSRTP